jgi:oxygen-dependent protoporphyrinogen oxidase
MDAVDIPPDLSPALPDDVAHAADLHVVVIGAGVAGLVAALQCAKVGLPITVVEASDRVGGTVRCAELDGLVLDVGAEGFSTRGGHVRALVDDLDLGDDVARPEDRRVWVAGLPGDAAAALPEGGLLGIPVNPFTSDVRAIIGWRGAWRAYADRLRPVLTIGQERSLGRLVRARVGDRVADRLVAPVTSGVYSADPDDIDVDIAAPGLNAALSRTGSLLSAVAILRAAREDGDAAVSDEDGIRGLEGGMTRLTDALRDRLEQLGARVRTGTSASRVTASDAGGWIVEVADDLDAESRGGEGTGVEGSDGSRLRADAVIVATPESEARRLLAPVVPGLAAKSDSPAPVVETVTLVLDAPGLEAHPRGRGVLTLPGSHAAAAIAHTSAEWEWIARAADGRQVVRVSFGGPGMPPATETMDDADAIALAAREASALLGVPFDGGAVRAAHRARFVQSRPASTIGHTDAARRAREAIGDVHGLGAVGSWLAGTGLAQVVPDAMEEGDRVRRAALWD